MNNVDLKQLREVVSLFRLAIEKCDKSKLTPAFLEFPHGACGDTSDLLGKYLADHGFGEFDTMTGMYGSNQTHAWLQQGDLVVDITADQFPDKLPPIIVEYASAWHKSLHGRKQNGIADFDDMRDDPIRIGRAYQAILEQLDQIKTPQKLD